MDYVILHMLLVAVAWTGSHSQHIQQQEPVVPLPYTFSYAAGRAPGHTDRIHAETSDGNGVIRGMFSYIDPRQRVRTVEYVADQFGFHPVLINPAVRDTKAVAQAKLKHTTLFNQIAAEQQRIALERGQTDYDDGSYKGETQDDSALLVRHPTDTPVVESAKLHHYNLYNQIAEEHQKLAQTLKQDGEDDGGALVSDNY